MKTVKPPIAGFVPKEICPHCGGATAQVCLACAEKGTTDTDAMGKVSLGEPAPPGFLIVADDGRITNIDETSAQLLGQIPEELLGKSFTLFLEGDAISLFFIHRNALFATRQEQKFELQISRADGSVRQVQMQLTIAHDFQQNEDRMQIALGDFSRQRRALDHLRQQLDMERLIQSVVYRLIRCPAREIDVALIRSLRLLALFAGVERTYLGHMNPDRTELIIAHEWVAPSVGTHPKRIRRIPVAHFPGLGLIIRQQKEKVITDPKTATEAWGPELAKIHIPGIQAWGYFPLASDDAVAAVIGFEALRPQHQWPSAYSDLFNTIGGVLLQGIFRKQDELTWLNRHKAALGEAIQEKLHRAAMQTAILECEPVDEWTETVEAPGIAAEAVPDDAPQSAPGAEGEARQQSENEELVWMYAPVPGDIASSDLLTVPLVGDNLLITCPQCMRQDQISQADFSRQGKIVQAQCICRYEFHVTAEQRSYYRKKVALEGVFIRTKGAQVLSESVGYEGKVQITNLSKKGLGFVTLGPNNLESGDEVRVKFILDNAAHSHISKELKIRGVQGSYAGGRFIGTDKDDVTLGFYLM